MKTRVYQHNDRYAVDWAEMGNDKKCPKEKWDLAKHYKKRKGKPDDATVYGNNIGLKWKMVMI